MVVADCSGDGDCGGRKSVLMPVCEGGMMAIAG